VHDILNPLYFCRKPGKLNIQSIKGLYENDRRVNQLLLQLDQSPERRVAVDGLSGSSPAFVICEINRKSKKMIVVIMPDRELALHMMNDLETLLDDSYLDPAEKSVSYFPPSYNNPYDFLAHDNLNVLYRNTILHRISSGNPPLMIVCCPESFIEPVVQQEKISQFALSLSLGEAVSMEFMIEVFHSYGFTQVDFVYEPGNFAVRGGIIDVFAFSYDRPYRIEFSGDEVNSIRSFNPYTQESVDLHTKITLLANMRQQESDQKMFSVLSEDTIFWTIPAERCFELVETEFSKYHESEFLETTNLSEVLRTYLRPENFGEELSKFMIIEHYGQHESGNTEAINFGIKPHPQFAKNFEVLFKALKQYKADSTKVFIFCENETHIKRIDTIIEDIEEREQEKVYDNIQYVKQLIHSGFIDPMINYAFLTDHQISERYHRFRFSERHSNAEALTVKDLQNIHPGDFVVHIDYGVGQYAGLEKIDVNGREQEAIRIVYKNNDLLYVSIHSLHKISKFTGKEGTEPQLDKIGSGAWQQKKYKAKSKVKDIAKELIKLYAERISSKGFAFTPDSYLQYELEASFMYEDTEDQSKATGDVKSDMEAGHPMDRLVCGDVGFGKTEVAIRAAFKAAVSGKQTAILVPTTILALQHFHTFSQRLKQFPVEVEYLNRFRSSAETKKVLDRLRSGTIDIIIGTHKLLGKEIEFKDLGLLVIDEEQKFGVSAKEKIRQLKVNVDTLTLTATPIPRTLQFSLMGARDLSIINTPPPNRQPVHTEMISFNPARLSEIIMHEVNRGGQVFFINNKILNIQEVAAMVRKICPGIRVEIGHGQMDGKELEKIVLDFIEGKFEVFVSTAIIESGIDIPNANTMIINDAHHFGLSDLHQLRGRVGRSNRKAFCYLITPSPLLMSEQSRKRIKALVEFSDLGSGLQIAMRDLDIRGAGNLLGAEQSGFISEIGYEMYKKILDEALDEIRQDESSEEADFSDPSKFVKDCQLETDLSLLIPDSYVSNFNERLALYKDLDSLQSEKQLQAFEGRLCDRFGELPEQAVELIHAVRLRWLARKAGIVRILLKSEKMTAFFYETDDERFYKSEIYSHILQYVFENPKSCIMKQSDKGQLFIVFAKIENVRAGVDLLKKLL
jgi:transcription-repair coupling factor (superfamily II helicase)